MRPVCPSRGASDAGYSLLELLIVAVMITTLSAVTAGFYRSARATVEGNANIRRVEALLKLARDTAVNERRAIVITYTAPNLLRLTRLNIPIGTTFVAEAYLEDNMSFMLFAGMPDTPDSFGRASAFDFGAAVQVLFTADGMLTDQLGNALNGTLFLGQPGAPLSARALTIFGPTSTMRSYSWNGTAWRH